MTYLVKLVSPLVLGMGAVAFSHAEPQGASADSADSFITVSATAEIRPTVSGNAEGQVKFVQNDDGSVTIVAEIEGLDPGSKHGFHIHEYGDCSHDEAESAGGHFNPKNHPHGLPQQSPQRHAGDLGNLSADEQGRGSLEKTVDNMTIAGMGNSVLGRSVIVHAHEDDGSQPTGNAGSRIGCGIIGITTTD